MVIDGKYAESGAQNFVKECWASLSICYARAIKICRRNEQSNNDGRLIRIYKWIVLRICLTNVDHISKFIISFSFGHVCLQGIWSCNRFNTFSSYGTCSRTCVGLATAVSHSHSEEQSRRIYLPWTLTRHSVLYHGSSRRSVPVAVYFLPCNQSYLRNRRG